jgi:cell division protein FtsI/penicillin-binding protein 2
VDNQKHSLRFISVFFLLIFCLLFFCSKLILIQVFRSEHLSALAEKQHNHYIQLDPVRGTIYDRRMRKMALNVAVYSLYANPMQMTAADKTKAVAELSGRLGLNPVVVKERLAQRKYFVWLARKLPIDTAEQIRELKIKGLDFVRESKRYYPNQFLASHLIGFAGIDNDGLEGLELVYDHYLKGEPGWTQVLRDARQRDLLITKGFIPPKDGFDLVLTIDETIQYIAERALEKAFVQHKAQAASIIVLDPRTGEILAMANRPTYDLSEFSKSADSSRTNRSIAYVYEPGSVFKIVAVSAALEEGITHEDEKIFCENGNYRVGNHTLHDHHPHGTLSFREVIEQSSNIGTTKIAQRMGPEVFYRYAKRFRFGEATGIGLKGEVPGYLKPPTLWSKTSIGALPIGHEVTVTPLQMVCAIAAIANDGVYMKPYMVKYVQDKNGEVIHTFHPQVVDRVISEETAHRVADILKGAVERGTGKKTLIEGISVAGKTGTAQKVINGQYSHNKFYASFIGFAPVEDPRIAMVVVFDEPHPSHFGGTVAAPVFKEVLVDALRYLEIDDEKLVGRIGEE